MQFVQPAFQIHCGDAAAPAHRHLRRELVVVAVVALEALVARDVARAARQDGDAIWSCPHHVREDLVERRLLDARRRQ